ncbi:lycopene cyclase domain-containing protein [Nocardioides sp. ChNu-153]|uniref:lycopene cyclase domain-containing protein n=1 Tax=unclassified Nocardioides TaxID=2615069 RepID=UPI002405BFB1|nr:MULTISPECIES: lycopene cyclase domain-containing protein [unclassified Nocardioides]MDF9715732.1 lycopene cyclase domain-containing protein [Nocardioides sp. ChNu-99]MDN7121837.1 lycopene cyclase domain-containing protein [Nocardioides sp. ChNu-153]
MTHTEASLLGIAVTVVLDLWVLRTRLLTRRAYWASYAIVLFFQLLTNEYLTSRGVFVYDEDAILGWRIGHAPVEDFLFGYSLVTLSLVFWVWWGRRGVQPEPGPGPIPAVTRLLDRTRRD